MYIEFRLPGGAGGMTAQFALSLIRKELHKWSDKYNIPYNTQLDKYVYRVQFDDDAMYAFFKMSWNPEHHSTSFNRITIVDADLPKEFTK